MLNARLDRGPHHARRPLAIAAVRCGRHRARRVCDFGGTGRVRDFLRNRRRSARNACFPPRRSPSSDARRRA